MSVDYGPLPATVAPADDAAVTELVRHVATLHAWATNPDLQEVGAELAAWVGIRAGALLARLAAAERRITELDSTGTAPF
ncbi:hypothetical protein OG618_37260 (plasmid) [Kitasatospora sp. NBC_01246]|uniref:hypothetical protein n=1 Tax=Kitasatospora sp. NBC_01246 TaxID=2903570 RepID=UPI002E36522A|nr:hypothetical protein [Kitasatospora sp. NBC_01246]